MAGLSNLMTIGANAVNGYNTQQYINAERADQEAQMQARQQTYQPAANAQIAASGLSQAQSDGQAALVPQQTQVASTNLGTQQIAATGAQQTQPLLNQTANNQATVQAGMTGTQASLLSQTQSNMSLAQLSQNQQSAMRSTAGLYPAMMQGTDAVRNYVQQEADSGAYPELAGKKIGQVGLTPDGQNFVAQDDQGNVLVNTPVSHIQQAYQMTTPTDWKTVGNTLMGTRGGQVVSQTSAPEFKALQPGETGVITNGNNVTSSMQAAVPASQANRYTAPEVQTMQYLQKGNPKLSTTDAYAITNQAKTLSKEAFIQQGLPNMLTLGGARDANDATQKLMSAWDYMHPAPGLSQAPGSNSNPSSTINSLIGAQGTTPNPFTP